MRIGIIGGGQLGMMMAEEAKKLGHFVMSLDPNKNCSITQFSDCHIAKDYNDSEALELLAESTDVITYEFENVDLDVLKLYKKKIPQKLKALEISRNRIVEKNYAKDLGIKTPKFELIYNIESIFYPSILKTTTGGYDGKGQYKIIQKSDIDQVSNIGSIEYICEELIEFDYEISVVATRDEYNKVISFPVPKNVHKNGILHTSLVDNSVPKEIEEKAINYTKLIINDLDYVGTLAVEYFVVGDAVLFNEFAPRPHNSGHYTMNGCNVSQFLTHIEVITGKRVTTPELLKPTLMLNVLGQSLHYYELSKDLEYSSIHDYYKNSDRVNRKVGHINYDISKNETVEEIYKNIIKE